jgi:hypothetical protein
MKKSYLVFVSFLSLVGFVNNGSACSISVNQLQSKNILISAAANEFNISLTKATKIIVANFGHELVGTVPGSSCEQYLDIKGRVTIAYSPNKFEKCELSVDVTQRQDLHAESYPFEEFLFALPSSSCSRIPIVIRPRPIGH